MLAGMAAKWRWRAKRRAAGKPTNNPNTVCGPVQVVWHKFARYWDIEIREVPMAPGRFMMDPDSILKRVDENTIMVVPTFGVTYTGAYEPVAHLAAALAAVGANAVYNSITRKLDVASRQNKTSVSQSPAVDSLACTTVAAPAATSVHGCRKTPSPAAGPQRQMIQPRHPARLLAGPAHTPPPPQTGPDQHHAQQRSDHQGAR
jgi:hypothetical protein